MRRAARLGTATLTVLAMIVATAAPASAHTVGGVAPTNYRSQVISVTPPTPGLHVRLLDLGRRIEVTNTGSEEILILAYADEPYLRVGPDGVFENHRSPAHFTNQLTPGAPTPVAPPTADPAAPPDWHHASDRNVARWRDHRTRWEGPDPPAVRQDPAATTVVVPRWDIELRKGTTPIVVSGTITWVPGPSAIPWLLTALGLAATTFLVSFLRSWGRPLSAVAALLVAADIVGTFAASAATHDTLPVQLLKVLLGGFFVTVAWVMAILAIGPLQEEREGAIVAAGTAGLIMAIMSGLAQAPYLGRSQVPSDLPPQLARLGVALALGLGLGLVGATANLYRRTRRQHDDPVDDPKGILEKPRHRS